MSVSTDQLREMMRGVVRDVLLEKEGLKKLVDNQQSHADHVSECPNCFKEAIMKLNKTSDYACKHCGLPLGNLEWIKKLESCPNCGHQEPRKVR